MLKITLIVLALIAAALPPALAAADGRSDGDGDPPRPRDIVQSDDVIIDGSLCVGFDCYNGYSFGYSTQVLSENNLRVRFVDTSNSASFPTRDWQLEMNSSSNGGASYFMVRDCFDTSSNGTYCGGQNVLTIEAGAGNDALYIESGGRVGLGTDDPYVDLHMATGNTPTLRLDQDGSGGWTPQVWDVAGNEANFFVRDVTHGSHLPLRIRPGAPSSSLDIATDGDVGMGISSPEASLHIERDDGTARLLVDENSPTVATRTLMTFSNNGGVLFKMDNEDSGQSWVLRNHNNHFWIRDATASTNPLRIEAGAPNYSINIDPDGNVGIGKGNPSEALDVVGNIVASGSITPSSDVALKTAFRQVDALRILEGVASLDIQAWQYRADPVSVRHLGPTAQDFAAAFGWGATETGIATVDADGVALVSIQALYRLFQQQEAEIDRLSADVGDLTDRLEALEALVADLTGGS